MDGVFSPWHIIIVVILGVVLFYRGDKLPDMARSIGRSLRVFKTEIKGLAEDDKAREAAQNDADDATGPAVNTTKAIEAPSAAGSSAGSSAGSAEQVAPRVVPQAAAPIPVHAEIVRDAPASRPRPRPAGSAPRP